MIDLLLGVSASALLLVAVVARGLALKAQRRLWTEAATVARVGAALILAAALAWGIYKAGGWWANDLWLLGLGLVLAMLLVDLGLTRACDASCASPVLEGLGAVSLLVIAFGSPMGKSPILCTWGWIFYYARWTLYLIGVGSLIAAGSATIVAWIQGLQVGRGVTWHGPVADDSTAYVRGATLLALLAMGSGLTLDAWWSWRALGRLTGDDVREVWMAIAWLVFGSSVLAWELTPRARRWATGLVVLAGVVAVAGLMVTL
jgi:hypothetical protein